MSVSGSPRGLNIGNVVLETLNALVPVIAVRMEAGSKLNALVFILSPELKKKKMT